MISTEETIEKAVKTDRKVSPRLLMVATKFLDPITGNVYTPEQRATLSDALRALLWPAELRTLPPPLGEDEKPVTWSTAAQVRNYVLGLAQDSETADHVMGKVFYKHTLEAPIAEPKMSTKIEL